MRSTRVVRRTRREMRSSCTVGRSQKWVFGLLMLVILLVAVDELDAQASADAGSTWWSESRIGADIGLGRGMFLASGFIGSRRLQGQAGPWLRTSFVGVSMYCPAGSACETEAWSLGAGGDLVVLRWSWGLTSVAAGWKVTFWEAARTHWSPIFGLSFEADWASRIRPFVNIRFESEDGVGSGSLLGLGIALRPAV